MPRPEKVAAVAEIKERIESAKAVFLAEYAGLSVKEQQDLRRKLREQGAEFKVVKMTLARRAAAGLEIESFEELLVGPTGITFADSDAVSAAKALKEFASSHDVFSVKGGLLGTDFLTADRIEALAEIAPRDELLAMLAGAMKAPLTSMAGLLAALPRQAATVLQQLLEKKESGEFVPASSGAAEATDDVEDDSAEEDAAAASEAEATPGEAEEDDAAEADADRAAPEDVEETSTEASDDDAGEAGAVEDADDDEVETPAASAGENADQESNDEEPAGAAEEEE